MNVWLLQTGEPLPLSDNVRQMRTGLLADKLAKRGHSVRWWTSAFEHQRKIILFDKDREISVSPNLTLQMLHGCGYQRNVSFKRYLDHIIISKKFRKVAYKLQPPDILISSLPCHHLSYEAARYANANKIPIIIDIRDLWPDIFLSHLKHPIMKKLGTTALTLDFARLRYLLKNADALVAVSPGYLDWALERAGRSAHQWDRFFPLGYQPNKEDVVSQNSQCSEWLRNIANKKLLIFIGTFGLSYDLKLLLQAAKHMKLSEKNDIYFVIAGTGEQEIMLKREALNLSNVIFPGWIDSQDIKALLKCGTVGILPYVNDAPQGIPNKCFEYLSAGLPLISSLEGEMRALVHKYKVGLNYKPGDLESLCNAIKKLLDDDTLWQELSKNALAFFDKYGDAEKIYDNYALHIENLALLKK